MSLRKYRARKHARRELPVQDIDSDQLAPGDDAEDPAYDAEGVADGRVDDEEVSPAHAAKQQEIWDAFREEHNHGTLSQI